MKDYYKFLETILDKKSQYLYDVVELTKNINIGKSTMLIAPIDFYKLNDPSYGNSATFNSLYGSDIISINSVCLEQLKHKYKDLNKKLVLLDKYKLSLDKLEDGLKSNLNYIRHNFESTENNCMSSNIIRSLILSSMRVKNKDESNISILVLKLKDPKTNIESVVNVYEIDKHSKYNAIVKHNSLYFIILYKSDVDKIASELSKNDEILFLCEYTYIPIQGDIEIIKIKK